MPTCTGSLDEAEFNRKAKTAHARASVAMAMSTAQFRAQAVQPSGEWLRPLFYLGGNPRAI